MKQNFHSVYSGTRTSACPPQISTSISQSTWKIQQERKEQTVNPSFSFTLADLTDLIDLRKTTRHKRKKKTKSHHGSTHQQPEQNEGKLGLAPSRFGVTCTGQSALNKKISGAHCLRRTFVRSPTMSVS